MPVDGESFGLPTRPVEREHELGAEPLAVWMLDGERLQLRHERKLAAQCELGVDSFLDRGETKLIEALDLHTGERLELEVGKRSSVPQGHRARKSSARSDHVAGRERFPPRRGRRSKRSRSSSPGSTRSR